VFKKIAEKLKKLKELASKDTKIDPAVFNDPIAEQTEWNSASKGGANFQTHHLVELYGESVEFAPTRGLKLFCSVFALFGAFALVATALWFSSTKGRNWEPLIGLAFGIVFCGIGIGLYRHLASPIVFDKRNGFFWKGRTPPHEVFDTSVIKYHAQLNEIHALQLLQFWNSGGGDSSGYYYYELNLVLKTGKRLNVVTYARKEKIRKDAATLSEFLGVPVWDTIPEG